MTGRPHRNGDALWEVVYTRIHDEIQAGVLLSGAEIGTLASIAGYYDVSKSTAQRAMNTLRRRGYIIAKPGIGYFVARIPPRIRNP